MSSMAWAMPAHWQSKPCDGQAVAKANAVTSLEAKLAAALAA